MIERTPIDQLPYLGPEHGPVTIGGFVDGVREHKGAQFVIVADETGMAQVTHSQRAGNWDEDTAKTISGLTEGSVVEVSGPVKYDERVRLGGLEIPLSLMVVHSLAEAGLPVRPDSDREKRLDWRHIDLRRPELRLIFEIETTFENALREYWVGNGYMELHSPKFVAQPSEGGAEEFAVPYFGQTVYLAQSPQFYKQGAQAAGFTRVFEIGPAFRADPSHTSRHSTEFTSIDAELSWVTSHHDVMDEEEAALRAGLAAVRDRHGATLKRYYDQEIEIPDVPFPRISLSEARRLVAADGYEIPGESEDLDPEAERRLCRIVREQFGSDFVFVTDYPVSVRPFYHMRHEDNPTLTRSFDLLWRGVEITTGAQREHRYDRLVAQAVEKGLDPTKLDFYLNFFHYGCPPHGGYGLGLARVLMKLTGLDNIREVTFLHRGPNRVTP